MTTATTADVDAITSDLISDADKVTLLQDLEPEAVNILLTMALAVTGNRKIFLTPAAEDSDAIVVSGVVTDGSNNPLEAAVEVLVRTLAVTADKGDITVTEGTEVKTVNPATGENISWITTEADGTFEFSVANDQAEVTLVQVSAHGALVANLKLTFAA